MMCSLDPERGPDDEMTRVLMSMGWSPPPAYQPAVMYPWKRAVCWDKDSTMADTSQRQWMVEDCKAGRRPWADYSRACLDDKPNLAARSLMQLMAPWCAQIVMSGATECPEARQWLRDHRFPCNAAYFRPEYDAETDGGMLKVGWIKDLQRLGTEVVAFVEDVPEIARMIREKTGVPVMLVNPDYGDGSPYNGQLQV